MKSKTVLMTLLPIAAGIALTGCKGDTPSPAQSAESAMALQAATSLRQAALLTPSARIQSAPLPVRYAARAFDLSLSMETVLPTLDFFLENGFQVDSVKEEGEFASGEMTYRFKETISYKDLSGQEKSYSLLYNQTGSFTETEEDEKEVTTNFEGVALIGEAASLRFESSIKWETEGKGSESSVRFTVWTGADSYVSVEQEHEAENGESEMEFAYRVVSGGRTVCAFEVGIESKGENRKVEYEIGGLEFELEKRVDPESGETLYLVELETEGGKEAKAAFRKVVDENGDVSFSLVLDYGNK